MSRLRRIPVEDWDEELVELTGAATAAPIQLSSYQIYAHKPSLAKVRARYAKALWAEMTLPPRLLELVRLRIALFNQCRMCLSVRYKPAIEDNLTESAVCEIVNLKTAEELTAAEKSALDFATRLATDHLSITQETYDGLLEHFSEAQIVELGTFIGFALGSGRFQASLDNIEDTDSAYATPEIGAVTPWSGRPLVIG
jgi:alkylhydroperoxidase family enzyme